MGELYDGKPPSEDVDTSREAAASQIGKRGSVRDRLYRWGRWRREGWTDDECEVASGLTHQTISARRRELVLLGQVRWTGRYRKTRTGRRARVWMVTLTAIPGGKP